MKNFKISIEDFEKLNKKQTLDESLTNGEEIETEEGDSKEKQDLKATIEKISDEYENLTTRTYGDIEVSMTQEKEYEMPTIEETTQKATEEIAPLYDAKKQAIEAQGEIKTKALEEEKDELYQRVEDSLKTLKSTYDDAVSDTSSQALKRGLARSSIVLNQLADLEKSRAYTTENVLSQRDKEIAEILEEIENLKLETDGEISVITQEKVKKINERVDELVEKYQKEQDDVFEYNNKIRKEKADTLTKLKQAGINATEENSNEYVKMISQKTKAFYSYYYSLGENAKAELEKDREFVEEHLGAKGYQALMRYFND